MRQINKKILLLVLCGGVLVASCRKTYLDINEDPNRPTEDNITADLIFPQAANAVGARNASLNWGFLNNWLGYTAPSGSYAIDQTETTYNIDFTFGDALWQNHYGVLFDLYQAKVKALEDGDSVLAGASMILAAKLWQELVDLYGNIPYSQAFQNATTTTPEYDDARAIYTSLQLSLDTAKTYLLKEPRASFENVDIVNHGDVELWYKLANTFKLRLLIRQSEVPGFDPSAEITKIQDGGTELFVLDAGEDIFVNPGYSNTEDEQSPFYANYGLTPVGGEANPITRANNYFVNLLSNTSDPRLTYFYDFPASPANSTTIVGNNYGVAAGNPPGNQTSSLGSGLLQSATQPQWIYPAFEALFLEAEAIARGWVAGDAEAVYEEAVTENFRFLGVADAEDEAANYLQNQAIARWENAGGTPQSRARFIAYQKYIAVATIDPYEAYSDVRRLNMIPDNGYISRNPSRVSDNLPVRLLYPQSEYTTNAANVNEQGTINPFTSKIFWQP